MKNGSTGLLVAGRSFCYLVRAMNRILLYLLNCIAIPNAEPSEPFSPVPKWGISFSSWHHASYHVSSYIINVQSSVTCILHPAVRRAQFAVLNRIAQNSSTVTPIFFSLASFITSLPTMRSINPIPTDL